MPADSICSGTPAFSAWCRSTASAVGERQMFPVHTKSTECAFIALTVEDVAADACHSLALPRPGWANIGGVVVQHAGQRRCVPLVVDVLRNLERPLPFRSARTFDFFLRPRESAPLVHDAADGLWVTERRLPVHGDLGHRI